MKNELPYILALLLVLLYSCEREYTPTLPDQESIIVEGYIESGIDALPPFVVLSHSVPFLGEIEASEFQNRQITDAIVNVWHKETSYELTLVCLSDLPPLIREQVLSGIDIIPIDQENEFCVYIDLSRNIPIEVGARYDLDIELPDQTKVEGFTTIPSFVPIDSFRFLPPPGLGQSDSFARLLCHITDPEGEPNFYRYQTAINEGPFISGFATVTDDVFFDGMSFEFPLQKAESVQEGASLNSDGFGLFTRGDTARIRWMTIDAPHFQFWNSFEFSLNNQGPFSTYTRVSSNVSNAIGIWGGYATQIYTLKVPFE